MSYSTVSALMTGICDAIRTKDGTTAQINHQDIPDRIAAIETGMTIGDFFRQQYPKNPCEIDGICNVPAIFSGDLNLISIRGTQVTDIQARTFNGCSNLVSAEFPEVRSLGEYCFSNTASLEAFNSPECYDVGQRCFQGSGVETVKLGACSVSVYCFSGCSSLTTVEFTNLLSVADYAFENCSNLETIILRNTSTIPSLTSTAFRGASKLGNYQGAIYITDALVNSLKAATNWSVYAPIIYPLSDLEA